MKLNWKYDPEIRLATVKITEKLYYTCPDGGQTIHKYLDGKLVKTFHKYGPENKFKDACSTGIHMPISQNDEWPDEVKWLSETYPEVVGKTYLDWTDGFINRYGEIEDIGKLRGHGITDPEEKISINRMCSPANEVEWWDWEVIATKKEDIAEDCMGRGVEWKRHKVTGKIVRTSGGNPPYPCCVYPTIHGPYEVDESDIDLHGGERLL